ncbi:MAG: class I SAM-dependent methyltransferase, partial [Gammaproteobacteria bacterium]|nr:class I SAM-dependent methyltransferase [Gammaproteobacteria bacterium]
GNRFETCREVVVTDGARLFRIETANHAVARPDVCQHFKVELETLYGFAWDIDDREVNADVFRIRVFAIASDGTSFEIHPLEREEGDGFDAIRDSIATSQDLPVPGDGLPIPSSFGMHVESRASFLECAGDYIRMMARHAGLLPEHDVLDIGCGLGRIANGFSRYLSPDSRYVGFDIVASAIDWANTHVAKLHPNFRFYHLDLQNEYYNPAGGERQARFPIDEDGFDFALLASVFTHMHFEDVENYLVQANERLRLGGTLFATFFLMNEDAATAVRIGRARLPLELSGGIEHHEIDGPTLSSVSHEESAVFKLVEQSGFEFVRRPIYGNWTGARQSPSFQDIVIARKVRELDGGTDAPNA